LGRRPIRRPVGTPHSFHTCPDARPDADGSARYPAGYTGCHGGHDAPDYSAEPDSGSIDAAACSAADTAPRFYPDTDPDTDAASGSDVKADGSAGNSAAAGFGRPGCRFRRAAVVWKAAIINAP
jgi:hypothetical protein